MCKYHIVYLPQSLFFAIFPNPRENSHCFCQKTLRLLTFGSAFKNTSSLHHSTLSTKLLFCCCCYATIAGDVWFIVYWIWACEQLLRHFKYAIFFNSTCKKDISEPLLFVCLNPTVSNRTSWSLCSLQGSSKWKSAACSLLRMLPTQLLSQTLNTSISPARVQEVNTTGV